MHMLLLKVQTGTIFMENILKNLPNYKINMYFNPAIPNLQIYPTNTLHFLEMTENKFIHRCKTLNSKRLDTI